ncbi:MAG: GIY-YIG nuclease family protein [Patescibacteria group bacterium]|nr:GIY-YIG nuclease family protein [Patescibacteria group bacterium]
MYYVYILFSTRLKKIYKGFTSNLKRRFLKHNLGEVRSTKKGIPWQLVYYEAFLSKRDARREELFLKSGKGRERVKYLLKDIMEFNK